MLVPLAERIRPQSIDEVIGQRHLLGEGKSLRKIISADYIPNMIFYGPSGVGKTTVARIIAQNANMRLHKLNGTSTSTADIKAIVEEVDSIIGYNGILLYLDEIQYLNKKQQQSLLEHIENGNITLIASTTENPYFYIYNAILSRSTVFEFLPVPVEELEKAVSRGFKLIGETYGQEAGIGEGVLNDIAFGCGGDVRKAINTVELCYIAAAVEGEKRIITSELVSEYSQKSSMKYDRDGDRHFELLSALQKSIRGSDENAAIYYLGELLTAGDIISACRRLLVIAAEDIGLAYPQAMPVVKACCDAAVQLGLPEARLPLAEATILLATAPKSNSAYDAINMAIADIEKGLRGDVPKHLQNAHYEADTKSLSGASGYKYPHIFKNHYVKQQYLPDEVKERIYYEYGDNKTEQAAAQYKAKIIQEAE